MSVFELDEQGRKQLDEQAALRPLDLSTVQPGFFDGISTAVGAGILRGGARAGTATALAGAIPVGARDQYLSSFATDDVADFLQRQGIDNPVRGSTTAGQDAYFRDVVEGIGQNAVDAWTPDPTETGTAGRVLGGLSEIVLPLAAAGGNPSLLAATEGLERPAGLVKQGVGAGTAQAVGLAGAASTLLGFKLPAAFGTTLTQRLATGAAGNLALGAGTSAVQHSALKASGHDEQAKAFDPADLEARSVDLLTGLVFGGLAHATARNAPLPAQDAVLTARNAARFQRAAGEGLAPTEAAAVSGQQALMQAMEQMARGEQVNVVDTINPIDFLLPVDPDVATAQPLDGYPAFRRALESGGRADARNPKSSAFGADQFTKDTWRRIVAKTKPDWANGLTDAQLLDARSDPGKSAEMATALDAENAAGLEAAGLPVNAHSMYAAHHFGISSAKRFARSDDATPIERILTGEQIAANDYLAGRTKGEVIGIWNSRAKRAGVLPDGGPVDTNAAGQALRRRLVEDPDQLVRDYAALDDADGGRTLNTDTARELSPEYLSDRTRSADVHEAASDTVKLMYERKLAQPTPEGFDNTVLFTAGGTGAGKTTALAARGEAAGNPEIIYDTNMNTLSSAVDKIEQALAAGRDVDIVYVYRDPVDALVNGAIPRAERQVKKFGTGRTVPLREHARTHAGVRPTIEAIAARYADDPRVRVAAIDNSGGKGQQKLVDLASLPRVEEDSLHGNLQNALEQARAAGLADDLYRGFGGPGRSAQAALGGNLGSTRPGQGRAQGAAGREGRNRGEVTPTPESPLTAARQLAVENPDASIVVGADADGGAVHRSVADELADIEAELTLATNDSTAYQAAINCLIRRG